MDRCAKHDMLNCADCTGATARHQQSLQDTTHWESQQEKGSLPWLSGGTTIRSRFSGHCQGCGARFEAGDAIFSPHQESGWYADCCFESVAGAK